MSNLFLENDEDITSAIDKLGKVPGDEVRVVVPKRSTLLASIINLKLLKKAADSSKKKLVLVTGDQAIVNLASRVDLPVASNVNASAEIPEATEDQPVSDATEEIEDDDPAPAPVPVKTAPSPLATRDVPTEEPSPPLSDKKAPKQKRVPDFSGFQRRIMTAVVIAGVIIGALALNFFFKRADITISAKGAQIPTVLSFKAITDGTANTSSGEVKATELSDKQDVTKTFPATGKKDVGTKASGTISISNCYYSASHTFPAGTIFHSNGLNFVSTSSVTVSGANIAGPNCLSAGTGSASVTASANGDQYNLAAGQTYSVGNLPSSGGTYVRGSGGQMSGGTSKTLKIVSSTDIANAKAKLATADDATKNSLATKAGSDAIAAKSTYSAKVTDLTSDPAVGAEGDTFTVTATVAYTMLALDRQSLDDFIKAGAAGRIGNDNEVYDTGAGSADIRPSGGGHYQISTNVYAGAKLDQAKIKDSIKGEKLGAAAAKIEQMAGVSKAEISLSPFWVTTIPRLTSHIHIQVKVDNVGG